MSKKLSLRGLARALGYSVATLSEHRNAGIFQALPGGGYDLETVKRRLLESTSPNAKHRVRLEPKTVPNRTESAGISATYVAPTIGYDDDDEEPVELPPEQEAGVQTAMKHLRDDKVRRAINVLCGLPTKMARDMTKHDREVSLKGATNYFENLIVDNLRYAFTLPRRKAQCSMKLTIMDFIEKLMELAPEEIPKAAWAKEIELSRQLPRKIGISDRAYCQPRHA